jgi:hypothetical protein
MLQDISNFYADSLAAAACTQLLNVSTVVHEQQARWAIGSQQWLCRESDTVVTLRCQCCEPGVHLRTKLTKSFFKVTAQL